jgi:hypothetical protein
LDFAEVAYDAYNFYKNNQGFIESTGSVQKIMVLEVIERTITADLKKNPAFNALGKQYQESIIEAAVQTADNLFFK